MTTNADSNADSSSITALDILKETRDLFAQTHWTSSVLYTTDMNGKKQFCMVGGLCHIYAKNELPDWIDETKDQSFYASEPAYIADAGFEVPASYDQILLAEYELAKTIEPELEAHADSASVEKIIIDWNDIVAASHYRERGDASYVIEVMDETIERVEKEKMPNSATIFECDHLRPVVRINYQWRHIVQLGNIGEVCEASVYQVKAETEPHTLDKLVLHAQSSE